MSEYLRGEFTSAGAANTYATDKSQWYGRVGMVCTWKLGGPYLYFFMNPAGGAAIGLPPPAPFEYIVRTGESVWKAYEVPKILRDYWNQQQMSVE